MENGYLEYRGRWRPATLGRRKNHIIRIPWRQNGLGVFVWSLDFYIGGELRAACGGISADRKGDRY